MSILEYNGAAVLAMAGKNCVAIASDLRLGIQAKTIAMDFEKIFRINPKLYVGLPGLATDVQTLEQRLKFRMNMYKLREERDISPATFGHMLSHALYEKRFGPWFVEPIIAGLDEKNQPYISSMDLIGAECFVKDFTCAGTATENLLGMCESLYRPDMNPEELFEVISQALLASVDRDALSGWGAVVHIITPEGVLTKKLKVRQD